MSIVPQFLCIALFSFAASVAWAQKSDPAGTVDVAQGEVSVTSSKGKARTVTEGMSVEAGDTITTGAESELHATMADGAYMAVRANSKLKIAAYTANGNAKDRTWFELARGGLRMVTGWVAKTRPTAYRVKTPTATVGVRGTDHEVIHLDKEDAPTEEDAGTHSVVYEGSTFLQSARGRLELQAGQAAVLPLGVFTARLHDIRPEFLNMARGQFEDAIENHRTQIFNIMERNLIERGLMREGENMDQIFRRMGVPGGASLMRGELPSMEQIGQPGAAPKRPLGPEDVRTIQNQIMQSVPGFGPLPGGAIPGGGMPPIPTLPGAPQ